MEKRRMTPAHPSLRVVMLGAGNVASALAPALDALEGVGVAQVYSRTIAHARELAGRLHAAEAIDSLDALSSDADVVLVSLTDDALMTLPERVTPRPGALWLHTSGSVDAAVLAPLSDRYGVFYPLQTFSRSRRVDMDRVPIFVEGSSPEVTAAITALARRVTPHVYDADSGTRRVMHIAAVFACNFTNHLWAIASDLLATRGLPLTVLEPLLLETLHKAMTTSPDRGQTGPASRGDVRVMEAHEQALSGIPKEIYHLLSQSIISRKDEQN